VLTRALKTLFYIYLPTLDPGTALARTVHDGSQYIKWLSDAFTYRIDAPCSVVRLSDLNMWFGLPVGPWRCLAHPGLDS
jgi:hypothetical protein